MREIVENFLEQFKVKARTIGMVVLRKNSKNLSTFAELEFGDGDIYNLLFTLNADDYYKGPNIDSNNPQWREYWEFGKMIKGKQIYIKLSNGGINKKAICISFHIAERKIIHPLRL